MQKFVVKYNNVDPTKIIFEDFKETNDGKFVVSKIWYQENENTNPNSFFVQTSNLKIHDLNGDCVSLSTTDVDIYNSLDTIVLNKVKTSGIVKKYGLKNTSYKSTVGEATNNNKLDVLRFNKFSSAKFFTETKTSKSYNDVRHLLNNNSVIKAIFEVDKVIVDITKNYIFTYMNLVQVQIKTIPRKLELSEYSFIEDDSDNEQTSDNNFVNTDHAINETILGTQTEYMDENSNSEDNNVLNNKLTSDSKESDDENEYDNDSDQLDDVVNNFKFDELEKSDINNDEQYTNSDDSDNSGEFESEESDEKSVGVNDFLKNLSKIGKNKSK